MAYSSLDNTQNLIQDYWISTTAQCREQQPEFCADLLALQDHLAQRLHKHADVPAIQGVLIYGSNLREQANSLLDAYVIVNRYQDLALPAWHGVLGRLLPPNVYQTEVVRPDKSSFRVKFSVTTLNQFDRHNRFGFHGYFWARFAQPTLLLGANETTAQQLASSCAHAALRTATTSLALVPSPLTAADLWEVALAQTYASELRTESSRRNEHIVQRQLDYFQTLTATLVADGVALEQASGATYCHTLTKLDYAQCQRWWQARRLAGKGLSLLRLMKASLTFNDGVDYLLWKIQRHTGIEVTATQRARRYPLIFAWPLVWRLYRLGAFK